MEQITRDWITHYDCLPKEFQHQAKIANYGVLTAAIVPNADLSILIPLCRWMVWAFVFDDFYGPFPKQQLKLICRKALSILNGQNAGEDDNDLFKQLVVVRNELTSVSNPMWMQRFIQSHTFYFQGLLLDRFSYQPVPEYPTVSQYFRVRDRLIGGVMVMDLLELIDTIFPEELFQHPRIQLLRLLASRLMIYDNDIFSYKKELREGESMNLVLVIQAEQKTSLDEAVDIAITMRKKEYEQLLEYEGKFHEFGKYSKIVKNYFLNTMILLEGQLVWYKKKSERYN